MAEVGRNVNDTVHEEPEAKEVGQLVVRVNTLLPGAVTTRFEIEELVTLVMVREIVIDVVLTL